METKKIEAKNLEKQYVLKEKTGLFRSKNKKIVQAVKGVSLEIPKGKIADLKNVCSSHEFIVETIKADDAEYLSSVFTDAQLTAKDTLLFLGEQFKMFEVLEFITEHKI